MKRVKASLSRVSLSIVLAATMITLTGFGISDIAPKLNFVNA